MDEDRKKMKLQKIKNFFRSFVLSVRRIFLDPRQEGEEARRKEHILNIILGSTIIFLAIFEAITLFQWLKRALLWSVYTYHGIPPLIFTMLFFVFASLLYLSRKGFPLLASFGLVSFYFIGATYGAASWGPDLHQVAITYSFIIIMTGILISSGAAFYVTFVIGATILTFCFLNISNVLSFNDAWKWEGFMPNDAVELSVTYFMIALISWLSNREIGKSLRRAWKSEKELQEKNDSLEETIEIRTKELHKTQADKMAQLYRFAEFGRLSSGFFHDLINPLTAVASNVRELESSLSTKTESLKTHIDKAVVASQRMEKFLGAVKKQINLEGFVKEFCLNDEIEEGIALLSHKAAKEGIVVRFEAKEKISFYGNPIKFQQIITNLVANAIDSYDGLPSPQHKRDVCVTLSKKGEAVNIKVTDCGCGISKEILQKIFDPFFTTKNESKGIGLGLSTVKEVVEKDFNGSLRVESFVSKGSMFEAMLPLRLNETRQ